MVDYLQLLPGLPDDVAMACLSRVPYRHHYRLRGVSKGWRNFVDSPSFFRQRLNSSSTESLVCLVQALKEEEQNVEKEERETDQKTPGYALSLYNATQDEWRRLSLPQAVPLFSQCAAMRASGKFILLGGYDPHSFKSVSDVFIVDLITGNVRRGAPMKPARSFFACAMIGSLVYVAGGHDNQKNALRSAQVYDTEADEWREIQTMAVERDECQGLEIGGEFWVISGYCTDNQGQFHGSVECYDPGNGRWRVDESLWEERVPPRASSFVLPRGGKLGHAQCNEGRREVREYEEIERRWKVVGNIPGNLRSVSCVTSVGGSDGRLLVMGSDGESRYRAWMMDTGSRRWSEVNTPDAFAGFAFSASSIVI